MRFSSYSFSICCSAPKTSQLPGLQESVQFGLEGICVPRAAQISSICLEGSTPNPPSNKARCSWRAAVLRSCFGQAPQWLWKGHDLSLLSHLKGERAVSKCAVQRALQATQDPKKPSAEAWGKALEKLPLLFWKSWPCSQRWAWCSGCNGVWSCSESPSDAPGSSAGNKTNTASAGLLLRDLPSTPRSCSCQEWL